MCEAVPFDERVGGQKLVHPFPERPRPLAMDHPHLPETLQEGGIQVLLEPPARFLDRASDQVDLRGDGVGRLHEEGDRALGTSR
jgi:hypothetical protein